MRKKNPDAWGVKAEGNNYVGPNLLGRLLMELRDNGTLTTTSPTTPLPSSPPSRMHTGASEIIKDWSKGLHLLDKND